MAAVPWNKYKKFIFCIFVLFQGKEKVSQKIFSVRKNDNTP